MDFSGGSSPAKANGGVEWVTRRFGQLELCKMWETLDHEVRGRGDP